MLSLNKFTKIHLLLVCLSVLLVLGLSSISDAKFDVHVIYFKPTDAGDIDRGYHDRILKDIQKYLQFEMDRHGFTDKTFPLELDEDDGKIVIHTINGNHNGAHYYRDDIFRSFKDLIEPELPVKFNNQRNIDSRDNVHLIIIGGLPINEQHWQGVGFAWHGGKWGGNAVVNMNAIAKAPNHYLGLVAHELGHAFALDPGHNNVPQSFNGTVVAWGNTTQEWGDRMRILKEEAVLLDSRPIFRKINMQDIFPEIDKNTTVLMYIGDVSWVTAEDANHQSQTAKRILSLEGIQSEITKDENYVKDWMTKTTSDGKTDVLILYGVLPSSIYPSPNKQMDNSIAEIWIESTDGDTILNHGDYFGFVGGNGVGALQAIMDTPNITMWDFGLENNTPMIVTKDGKSITPSLTNFKSDRAFHLDELIGNWFAEKVFASSTGTSQANRADPVIVRDGNLGRIGIVFQTLEEINPKGKVVAEIIVNFLLEGNDKDAIPNKNPDLGMGSDTVNKGKGEPISINPNKKLTTTWGSLKQMNYR